MLQKHLSAVPAFPENATLIFPIIDDQSGTDHENGHSVHQTGNKKSNTPAGNQSAAREWNQSNY